MPRGPSSRERDWEQFQDPKSVMLALVGEVGELAELLQWLPADAARDLAHEEPLHTRLSEEMADVLVYLVGLADQCGVDLGAARAVARSPHRGQKHPSGHSAGCRAQQCGAVRVSCSRRWAAAPLARGRVFVAHRIDEGPLSFPPASVMRRDSGCGSP